MIVLWIYKQTCSRTRSSGIYGDATKDAREIETKYTSCNSETINNPQIDVTRDIWLVQGLFTSGGESHT